MNKKNLFQKIYDTIWTRMPVYGRWIIYLAFAFIIAMAIWGEEIQAFVGW